MFYKSDSRACLHWKYGLPHVGSGVTLYGYRCKDTLNLRLGYASA